MTRRQVLPARCIMRAVSRSAAPVGAMTMSLFTPALRRFAAQLFLGSAARAKRPACGARGPTVARYMGRAGPALPLCGQPRPGG
jgi:hypothetical protein